MLISKAQAGDRDSLNELVSAYWQPVYLFIQYKADSPDDAQELTQETFFRAFRALPSFQQTDSSFKSYLIHIAYNLLKDFWRKKGRSPMTTFLDDYQGPVATDDQPDIQSIHQERREAIAKVLQELPGDQRRAIELRILAGLSVRDTALAMDKSEAAIKMLQQRALKGLRILLVDRGIVENGDDWRCS